MRTETMTVTHALTQLKILDARITTAIEEGTYITAIQPKSYAKSVETLTAEITGSMQRVNATIARYNAIKMAIVMSNASTKVTVGAKTYTVAEAIELKAHGIAKKQLLQRTIASQTQTAMRNFTRMDQEVRSAALDTLKRSRVDVDLNNPTAVQESEIYKSVLADGKVELVDPLNCAELLRKMTDDIDDFVANVDTALSISNATTNITFTYDDGNPEQPESQVGGDNIANVEGENLPA